MKTHYRAVVIGGGVVGASVLYHLAKLGWTDVALIERAELTAGSTWHAAAGFHAINADPNVAALQDYTIRLYRELEEESGQQVGLHMTGGINLAGTPERWEWLQSAWAVFKTMGMETARLVTPAEIAELCPIVDADGLYGGLYDANEGHLDPYGATHAYVNAARKRGADLIRHNRVLALRSNPDGSWTLATEQGETHAEHVVNAAGLWAKQVGMMAGVNLPVVPMEHHYLLTEAIPEVEALGTRELPLTVDLEGFTYLRQEGKGCLLGVYELNPKHWNVDGAPWDYGMELIPEDIERIAPELSKGFERFPCLNRAGIKRWVNGAFTFTPDGNPLVGPVAGVRNYWSACGVMAGFSQGGGVGLSLAQWMIHGEPGADIYGMDIARYLPFASNRQYVKDTTAQFYKRRFVLTYPNEQLPAGRPLHTTPVYELMIEAGARWGVSAGLEIPLYFAPRGFEEKPTLRRSNVHPLIGEEVQATRERVGMLDISAFSRYEITGPDAERWLEYLTAGEIPAVGRARLAPLLTPSGRLCGDLTLLRWSAQCFWLMGSYYLRAWHMRWFEGHRAGYDIAIADVSAAKLGFSLSGPLSRDLLGSLVSGDVSNGSLRFLDCREMDVGPVRARIARLSIAGELGYEINVPAAAHRALYKALLDAGEPYGLRQIGFNAVQSMRLEKSFGIWSREFTSTYTPRESGLDRFVAYDRVGFIGREAALRQRSGPAPQRGLVTLQVETDDADAAGFEPIWRGDRRVGFVTSGGYGHAVGKSLALAYVDREHAATDTELEVHIVGRKMRCRVLAPSPYDPHGARLRN